MRPPRSVALVALSGAVLAGWAVIRFADFGSPVIETIGVSPIDERATTRAAISMTADAAAPAAATGVTPIRTVATGRLKVPEPDIAAAAPAASDVATAKGNSTTTPEPVADAAANKANVATRPEPVAKVPAAPAPVIEVASADVTGMAPPETVFTLASADPAPSIRADKPAPVAAATDVAIAASAPPDARPASRPEPPVQMAALTPSDQTPEAKVPVTPAAAIDECLGIDACMDQYLFVLYERAPKLDTIKVPERIKVTVKKKGKLRTVTKIVTRLVDENFGWKDPKAADRVGMSLLDYVIGGMEPSFKRKLYHAMRAMDAAGLEPGITSAFRDDYRQGIASGKKAASDSSYHGGSRRGGYGHGLAADVVSVKGDTRMARYRSTEDMWKWIDAHEKQLGVGRPYLDRDPPHVGPIDGKEFADKRGRAKVAELLGKPASGWPYASVLALRRTQAAKAAKRQHAEAEVSRRAQAKHTNTGAKGEPRKAQVVALRGAPAKATAKREQPKIQVLATRRALARPTAKREQPAAQVHKRLQPAAQIRTGKPKERQAVERRRTGAGA